MPKSNQNSENTANLHTSIGSTIDPVNAATRFGPGDELARLHAAAVAAVGPYRLARTAIDEAPSSARVRYETDWASRAAYDGLCDACEKREAELAAAIEAFAEADEAATGERGELAMVACDGAMWIAEAGDRDGTGGIVTRLGLTMAQCRAIGRLAD